MNPFEDQAQFMTACGQTVSEWNEEQFNLYTALIAEEVEELWSANAAADPVACLDALIDIMVVAIGAMHSLGADAEGAWREVMRTNLAKIDPDTGAVRRRVSDGKILKPPGWQPPVLDSYLRTR